MADYTINRANKLADWLDSTFNNMILTDLKQKASEKRADQRYEKRRQDDIKYKQEQDLKKTEIKLANSDIDNLNFNIPSEIRINPETQLEEEYYPDIEKSQEAINALKTKYINDDYVQGEIKVLQNKLDSFATINQRNQRAENTFQALIQESKNIKGDEFTTKSVDELQTGITNAIQNEFKFLDKTQATMYDTQLQEAAQRVQQAKGFLKADADETTGGIQFHPEANNILLGGENWKSQEYQKFMTLGYEQYQLGNFKEANAYYNKANEMQVLAGITRDETIGLYNNYFDDKGNVKEKWLGKLHYVQDPLTGYVQASKFETLLTGAKAALETGSVEEAHRAFLAIPKTLSQSEAQSAKQVLGYLNAQYKPLNDLIGLMKGSSEKTLGKDWYGKFATAGSMNNLVAIKDYRDIKPLNEAIITWEKQLAEITSEAADPNMSDALESMAESYAAAPLQGAKNKSYWANQIASHLRKNPDEIYGFDFKKGFGAFTEHDKRDAIINKTADLIRLYSEGTKVKNWHIANVQDLENDRDNSPGINEGENSTVDDDIINDDVGDVDSLNTALGIYNQPILPDSPFNQGDSTISNISPLDTALGIPVIDQNLSYQEKLALANQMQTSQPTNELDSLLNLYNFQVNEAIDTGDEDFIDADLDSLVRDMMAGKDSTKIFSILDSLGNVGSP